jgi:hypothetical protein
VITGGNVAETAVEFEIDRAFRNVKAKFAKGAVIVFPTAVLVFEEVVAECLDRFPNDDLGNCGFVTGSRGLPKCDGCLGHRNRFAVADNRDHFDLSAVAFAVEFDERLGNVRGSQCGKDRGLVYLTELFPGLLTPLVVGIPGFGIGDDGLLSWLVDERRPGRADKPGGHRQGNGQHGFLERAAR